MFALYQKKVPGENQSVSKKVLGKFQHFR